MTNLDCLKALCERMFGYKTNGDNIADVLNDMSRTCEKDYSQTPFVWTGQKWFDGKYIYRLAVSTTLGELANEINSYKPETIVNFYGQALSTQGMQVPMSSTYDSEKKYNLDVWQDNSTHDVVVQYGGYYNDKSQAHCVLEFTLRGDSNG